MMRDSLTPRSPVLRRPLLTWVAGFTEPLVATSRREADEAEISLMLERWPDYLTLCLGGLLAGVAATLPPEDPWRSMTPQRGHELGGRDERTGAVLPNGEPFVDWRCATDLTPPIAGLEPDQDPSLIALASPLDPIGALLIAAAARSLAEVVDLCAEVRHRTWVRSVEDPATGSSGDGADGVDPSAGTEPTRWTRVVDYLGPYLPPLRWLLHRRRAYFGPEDHFFVIWAPAWIERARRVLEEERPLALELPDEPNTLASLTAPAGSYRELADGLLGWPEQ